MRKREAERRAGLSGKDRWYVKWWVYCCSLAKELSCGLVCLSLFNLGVGCHHYYYILHNRAMECIFISITLHRQSFLTTVIGAPKEFLALLTAR